MTSLTSASIENLLTTLLERFETLKLDRALPIKTNMPAVQAEIRSLDFWRSIVAECLASFFLVFIVCGSFVPWSGHTPPAIGIALAAGFSISALTLSFAHISGAHLNPVISLALLVTRKISPMKAFLYVTSQGGGAIAGAALLYGVTRTGDQGNLGATIISAGLTEWQGLGIELCLTFVIVLVYLTTMDDHRRILPAAIGPGPLTIGLTYTACSFVALPSTGASFNPMRSLGPAFVMNKWDSHWVYWLGPIVGGCLAGILYEFIFNPYRNSAQQRRKESVADGDSSSIHSDEDNYDDVKSTVASNYQAARSQHYDQYRPAISPGGASNPISPVGAVGNNWRNTQRAMLERAESVYGGTKSLYNAPCPAPKSPGFVTAPSSRTVNLNRSQSVYAKAPPSGRNQQQQQPQQTLQSAQSTYLTARNVDLIRTESIYAARPPQQPIYGARRAVETDMREPLYGRTLQDRSKPECYQLEPIYGTRRHPETIITASIEQQQQRPQAENLYGRSVQQNMDNSSVPISPSDTSKDSAYGSVHQHHHHPNAAHHPHDWSAGSSYQPVGNGHVYAQKFRTDLMSPTGGQHSPSSQNMTATPGSAFHSPVQY